MKKIPIGREFFKDIIEGDFYYVDKTKMIEELLDEGAYITLFPRPRRFGKTLMISTIDDFFNIEKAESNKELFKNVYIGKSKYAEEQGKYPVLRLDFKGYKADNWEDMYEKIQNEFSLLISSKKHLMEKMTTEEKNFFGRILNKTANKSEYELTLKVLSQVMERYYGEKVVLLIDEYDVPIQNGHIYGFYKDIVLFMKNLFGNGLKTNGSIKMGILTGILRVSKESVFSDLNNIDIYTVKDNKYAEYFGFTEEETTEILRYYNCEERLEEVKRMYDGYKFGKVEIYNPWSILNFVNRKELMPYWVNTSGDEILKDLFNRTREKTSEMVEKLILGEEVYIEYNEKITFLDLKNIDTTNATNVIGNFLLFSGYLTIESRETGLSDRYITVKIPNEEVKSVYIDVISKWTTDEAKIENDRLYELTQYILEDKKEKMEKILNMALQSMSFYDEHENFYHGYMLGLFVNFLNKNFIVKSNREAGDGRFDISIEKIDRSVGVIVEFKVAKEDEKIEEVALRGKEQIKIKEYYNELKLDRVEKILTYCVAYKGKKCKVV